MSSTFRNDILAGRVALVTGGTSGIGAAVAEALAAVGAVVTVTGATQAECDAARAAPGFTARDALPLDVRDDAGVRALIANLPRLDVLVNCAGTIRRGVEHDPAEFEQTVAINLTGTARCCAHARPKLAAGKGAIVNIASMYSFFGAPHAPGYASSKGGVVQLTRSLACAYAAEGIRVNAVAPGMDTDAAHAAGVERSRAQRADPGPHAARTMGTARRGRGRDRVPGLAGRGVRHGRGACRRRRLLDLVAPRGGMDRWPRG